MKYHIDKNGKPAICKAVERPCPLGGPDEHFSDGFEALAHADEIHARRHGLLPKELEGKEATLDFLLTDGNKYSRIVGEELSYTRSFGFQVVDKGEDIVFKIEEEFAPVVPNHLSQDESAYMEEYGAYIQTRSDEISIKSKSLRRYLEEKEYIDEKDPRENALIIVMDLQRLKVEHAITGTQRSAKKYFESRIEDNEEIREYYENLTEEQVKGYFAEYRLVNNKDLSACAGHETMGEYYEEASPYDVIYDVDNAYLSLNKHSYDYIEWNNWDSDIEGREEYLLLNDDGSVIVGSPYESVHMIAKRMLSEYMDIAQQHSDT